MSTNIWEAYSNFVEASVKLYFYTMHRAWWENVGKPKLDDLNTTELYKEGERQAENSQLVEFPKKANSRRFAVRGD